MTILSQKHINDHDVWQLRPSSPVLIYISFGVFSGKLYTVVLCRCRSTSIPSTPADGADPPSSDSAQNVDGTVTYRFQCACHLPCTRGPPERDLTARRIRQSPATQQTDDLEMNERSLLGNGNGRCVHVKRYVTQVKSGVRRSSKMTLHYYL